jgi:hypothetical protein
MSYIYEPGGNKCRGGGCLEYMPVEGFVFQGTNGGAIEEIFGLFRFSVNKNPDF